MTDRVFAERVERMAAVLRWFLPLAVIQTVVLLVVWATWRPLLLQQRFRHDVAHFLAGVERGIGIL